MYGARYEERELPIYRGLKLLFWSLGLQRSEQIIPPPCEQPEDFGARIEEKQKA
jgi:hypothetical protein